MSCGEVSERKPRSFWPTNRKQYRGRLGDQLNPATLAAWSPRAQEACTAWYTRQSMIAQAGWARWGGRGGRAPGVSQFEKEAHVLDVRFEKPLHASMRRGGYRGSSTIAVPRTAWAARREELQ